MTVDCVLLWPDQDVHPAESVRLRHRLHRLSRMTQAPTSKYQNVYFLFVFFSSIFTYSCDCVCYTDVCDVDVSDQRNPSDEAHPVPGAAVSGGAGRCGESDGAQEPLERRPGWFCHRRRHRCIPGEGEQKERWCKEMCNISP